MSEIREPVQGNPIDGAGPIKQTATLLFYGWGYNWYSKENQLRADDLLIRSKTSEYLQKARASLALLENSYRAKYLPPPTREHPLPDPSAIARAREFQELAGLTGEVETLVRTAPVPSNDKVWQRYRGEKDLLKKLSQIDAEMVDTVITLAERLTIATFEGSDYMGFMSEVRRSLEQCMQLFRKRSALLRI